MCNDVGPGLSCASPSTVIIVSEWTGLAAHIVTLNTSLADWLVVVVVGVSERVRERVGGWLVLLLGLVAD